MVAILNAITTGINEPIINDKAIQIQIYWMALLMFTLLKMKIQVLLNLLLVYPVGLVYFSFQRLQCTYHFLVCFNYK